MEQMMKFPDKFSISFLLKNYEQEFYPLYLVSDVKSGLEKILNVLQNVKSVNLSFILDYLLNFHQSDVEFILKLKKLFEFDPDNIDEKRKLVNTLLKYQKSELDGSKDTFDFLSFISELGIANKIYIKDLVNKINENFKIPFSNVLIQNSIATKFYSSDYYLKSQDNLLTDEIVDDIIKFGEYVPFNEIKRALVNSLKNNNLVNSSKLYPFYTKFKPIDSSFEDNEYIQFFFIIQRPLLNPEKLFDVSFFDQIESALTPLLNVLHKKLTDIKSPFVDYLLIMYSYNQKSIIDFDGDIYIKLLNENVEKFDFSSVTYEKQASLLKQISKNLVKNKDILEKLNPVSRARIYIESQKDEDQIIGIDILLQNSNVDTVRKTYEAKLSKKSIVYLDGVKFISNPTYQNIPLLNNQSFEYFSKLQNLNPLIPKSMTELNLIYNC